MAGELVQPKNPVNLQPPPDPPKTRCDLVMKGGITSGIVYPPAIFELKKNYFFRNIGGTSAGAVAAVGAAAAEFDRDGGGFDRLLALANELSTPSKVGKGSTLQNLFQASKEPQTNTQPLLDILNAALATLSSEGLAKTETTREASGHSQSANVGNGDVQAAPQRKQLQNSFLRLIQRTTPPILDNGLVVADELVILWSNPKTPYKPFEDGGRIGMRWGIVVGIGLALITSLFVLGLVSLFLSANNAIGRWTLFIAFIILSVVFSIATSWVGTGVGRVVAILMDVFDLIFNRIEKNDYGVCTGHTITPAGTEPDGTNLTDWLGNTIQEIAGRPPHAQPLTFGDLSDKKVELKLVTSNLSHGIPYVVPDGLNNYLFHVEDMLKLFPPDIVQHMIKHPPTPVPHRPETQLLIPPEQLRNFLPDAEKENYHYLPDPTDLPVLFGARLSLSFPFLLSAVPLYTLSAAAFKRYTEWYQQKDSGKQVMFALDQPGDLQKNWLSDGGISSNFPIQFFDAWLPSYPTFGINLTTMPTASSVLFAQRDDQAAATNGPVGGVETTPQAVTVASTKAISNEDPKKGDFVYLPRPADRQDPEWRDIESPFAFAEAIFGTAQNYRDTMQANLPSYRERIVQIRLTADEGGLNLTMPISIINTVIKKGKEAGDILQPEAFNFDHHWWVRFLVMMDQLEQNIVLLQQVLDSPTPGIEQRIDRQLLSKDVLYAYSRDQVWCDRAQVRVKALRDLIDAWHQGDLLFRDRAPTPNTVLRLTPEV